MDLKAAGELVNLKDKKGYRPVGWKRSQSPNLFDCGTLHGRIRADVSGARWLMIGDGLDVTSAVCRVLISRVPRDSDIRRPAAGQ